MMRWIGNFKATCAGAQPWRIHHPGGNLPSCIVTDHGPGFGSLYTSKHEEGRPHNERSAFEAMSRPIPM
jgi:hypothetical protein